MRLGLLGIVVLLVVTACMRDEYGRSASYRDEAPRPIEVQLPATARNISQQFFRAPNAPGTRHNGFDIVGPRNTPVIAAAAGTVIRSYYEPAYGNRMRIDHGVDENGQRVFTKYYHLAQRQRKAGDVVRRGEQIGLMGSTGALGLAVHLHFELHVGRSPASARAIDPHLKWINGVGRVTCFEPGKRYPEKPFGITYPTRCK